MKKLLKNLLENLTQSSTQRETLHRQKRAAALSRELRERIQIKEWGGVLYIAIDGCPLLMCDALELEAVEVLEEIRDNVLQYKLS